MLEVGRHIEGDGRNLMVRLRFLYQFKLQMLSSGAHLSAVSVVIDILGQENRGTVTRSERLELLQDSEKFRSYLGKIDFRIYLNYWCSHLSRDVCADVLVNAGCEFRKILFFHRQSRSINMAAEVLQKVRTTADGIIQVKSAHTAGRTGNETV